MGFFDTDEDFVQMTFEKSVIDAGGDVSKAENDPDVQQAVSMFAEQNNCSYDEAWEIAANSGKKLSHSGNSTKSSMKYEENNSSGSYIFKMLLMLIVMIVIVIEMFQCTYGLN